MAKYRKKPVVIEAEQFWPTIEPWPAGVERYEAKVIEGTHGLRQTWYAWRIETLEGWLAVRPGDWIITGVAGERYPCKPDIFVATYDRVEEGE